MFDHGQWQCLTIVEYDWPWSLRDSEWFADHVHQGQCLTLVNGNVWPWSLMDMVDHAGWPWCQLTEGSQPCMGDLAGTTMVQGKWPWLLACVAFLPVSRFTNFQIEKQETHLYLLRTVRTILFEIVDLMFCKQSTSWIRNNK